jgi:hypothetical protein
MSLIVDINPVPWKILDLVRARILKNRAKKTKKGTMGSKERLNREMSLQPGPLSRRKKDEASFIAFNDFTPYIGLVTDNPLFQGDFTLYLNGTRLGDGVSASDQAVGYLFIWSENTEYHESAKKNMNTFWSRQIKRPDLNDDLVWANVVVVEQVPPPEPNDYAEIKLTSIENNADFNTSQTYLGFAEKPASNISLYPSDSKFWPNDAHYSRFY